MPIQVSYGHISRAEAIRLNAIALLQDELPGVFSSTPRIASNASNPCISDSVIKTDTDQSTWLEHLIAFSAFVALGYALFVAVSR